MPMEHNGIRDRAREFISTTAPLGQSCKIILVNPTEVEKFWPWIEDYIEKSALRSYTGCSADSLYVEVASTEAQLWIIVNEDDITGVMVTSIHEYPKKVALRISVIGGENMKEWMDDVHHFIETWAMKIGCSLIEAFGRKGWAKYFPDYDTGCVVFTKELKDRLH